MLPTESGNDWEGLPASCRDKGWTWRRVGALCLSWWPDEWSGLREANRSPPHQDKHKAQYCSNKENGTLNSIDSSSAIHAQILLICLNFVQSSDIESK